MAVSDCDAEDWWGLNRTVTLYFISNILPISAPSYQPGPSPWAVGNATRAWKAVGSQGHGNPASGQNESQILKATET